MAFNTAMQDLAYYHLNAKCRSLYQVNGITPKRPRFCPEGGSGGSIDTLSQMGRVI